jgi:hypothetical protein
MRKRYIRLLVKAAHGVPLASTYLLLSFSLFLLPAGLYHPQVWKGYATVLLRAPDIPPEVVADLESLPGVEAVLCQPTARVTFNGFDGMESTTLGRLPERLQGVDPRFDPYLKSLPRYFRLTVAGAPAQAAYLRTRVNPFFLYLRLQRVAFRRALAMQLLEFDPRVRLPAVGLAGLYLAALLRLKTQRGRDPAGYRPWFLLAALPWLVNLLTGTAADLIAFFLLFPFLLLVFEEWAARLKDRLHYRWAEGERDLPAQWVLLAALWLGTNLLLLAPGQAGGLLLRGAAATGVDLIFLLAVRAFYRKTLHRRGHLPLEPLPILRGRLGRPRRDPVQPVVIGALLLIQILSLPLLLVLEKASGWPAPAPASALRTDRIGWDSLERLHRGGSPDRLPDLSDFVTHAAYQEGLSFGRGYSFPLPDERVYLSQYRMNGEGGPVVQARRAVKRYGPGWLELTLSRVDPGSVERMLLDQGTAAAVSLDQAVQRQLRRLPPWRIPLFTLWFLLGFRIRSRGWNGGGLKLTGGVWYSYTISSTRRKYPL